MATRSIGSCSLPSISRVTTWGLPTVSSKPSRRMVSTSTASWSSPRPWTSQVSGRSVGSTRSETLPISSVSSRLLDQAGGELGAVGAGQRRRVDADGHGQAGLVDGDGRQGHGVVGVGQGLADGDVGHAGHRGDLARARLVGGHPVQRVGDVELGDLGPLDRAVQPAPGHRGALAQGAVVDPADGQPADVGRGVEVADEGLQGRVGVEDRGGDVVDDGLEQRAEVGALHLALGGGPAGPGVGVEDGEVDLVLVGVEVQEELFDLVDDLVDAGVGPVDLVHDQDHRQAGLERLAQDEAGLGQGALRGVDQRAGRRRPW